MTETQEVLVDSGALHTADALLDELADLQRTRTATWARMLERVLLLDRALAEQGRSVGTTAELALALHCGEARAGRLLEQARVLCALPDALEVLTDGTWTVEQAEAFVGETQVLEGDPAARLTVWGRVLGRLRTSGFSSLALLRSRVRAWVQQADPAAAAARRRAAEEGGRVDYRRRFPDAGGVYDLSLLGISAPNAQAVLANIARHSAPIGPDDERSADRRRLDAAVDLLTGRQTVQLSGSTREVDPDLDPDPSQCGGRRRCGCDTGATVPCGAQVSVLVPLGAALGTTDELATLVGHGTVDAEQLQALLLAAPRLRADHVDADGAPVAVADRTVRPARRDRVALLDALLGLLGPPDPPRAEPPDEPGPYRVPTRLRRFVQVRAPRCEWPGCGAWAVRCDLDHDLPWPLGPTREDHLGPLCRRHHRVKQTGWTKARATDGLTWTSPTGRTHPGDDQHEPPAAPRSLPPLPEPHAFLTPLEDEEEQWLADPSDPWSHGLDTPSPQPDDHEPPDRDSLGERLRDGDTRWTLDLDDPYRWLPAPA